MVIRLQTSESEITGSLQAKIMMILRDENVCGVDIMGRLKIKSPGTIYPVLESLRKKGLIDYKLESVGATRKKVYFLTNIGKKEIKEHLVTSARFCCDIPVYMGRMLENVKGLIEVKRRQKVLCTLEYEDIHSFLKGTDVTFSYDLNVPSNNFDVALSFLGVGCLIGKETSGIADYVKRLHKSLKRGGYLLAIEIEKTDNLFSRMLFEDIFGLREPPGLHKEELVSILAETGFKVAKIVEKSGLLYAVAQKI